jgi:hypothetical protein
MTDTHVDLPLSPASEKQNGQPKIPFRRKIKRLEEFNPEDLDLEISI